MVGHSFIMGISYRFLSYQGIMLFVPGLQINIFSI